MRFSLKEWRRMYDRVHELGRTLRDSRPTYTEKGDEIAPLTELSKEIQADLEFKIKCMVERSNRYLDQCGMKMPKPLWYYDRKDSETWASHDSFQYTHLMEFK